MTYEEALSVMVVVASLARNVADLQRALALGDRNYILRDLEEIRSQRDIIVNLLQGYDPTFRISA